MTVRVGVLLRLEDESGVSGEGVVADLFETRNGVVILHWRSEQPSTTIFPNVKALDAVHGHGGKTQVVFYADLEAPKTVEELHRILGETSEEERVDELVEEVAEEVTEHLVEQARDAAKKLIRRRTEERDK